MMAPEIFAINVARGLSQPLPWWVDYIAVGKTFSVPPWEVFDRAEQYDEECPIPRRFWFQCGIQWSKAEQWVADHQSTKSSPQNTPEEDD